MGFFKNHILNHSLQDRRRFTKLETNLCYRHLIYTYRCCILPPNAVGVFQYLFAIVLSNKIT